MFWGILKRADIGAKYGAFAGAVAFAIPYAMNHDFFVKPEWVNFNNRLCKILIVFDAKPMISGELRLDGMSSFVLGGILGAGVGAVCGAIHGMIYPEETTPNPLDSTSSPQHTDESFA